jgi:phospholipid/cholesterol/gamma-HCH transport system substrate-binding protein
MMNALGERKERLALAVSELPDFLRNANTTFVNLRAALDDLDPLVDAAKPVAARLRPFLADLRAAAADAVPTVRDLDAIVQRSGPANDLVDLNRIQPRLTERAVGSGSPRCGADPGRDYGAAADDDLTQGAFGEAVCALTNGLPPLAFLRPYTTELVGWFNDFGTSGQIDANGTLGRISTTFNTFSFSDPGAPEIFAPPEAPEDSPAFSAGNTARCPGNSERDPGDGSTPFTDDGSLDCDPSQVPVGP